MQCPDCGALTTQYGGLFVHETHAAPEFKKAVDMERNISSEKTIKK